MGDQPAQVSWSQPARRERRLARSTLLVICAFAGAKLISLVQTVVIAQVFGLSSELDAYVAANGLPELIYTLIAGGAMAHAFIPVFSGLLARGDRDGAWRTATLVINCVFLATLLLSLLTFLAAPGLVATLVAPGFDETVQAQTVILMRILLLTTLIFSVSGICMGILQSHNHFLLPALAPVLYDVGILFGVLFLIPQFGVYGIAWGAVLGAALHLGIQVPGLLVSPRPSRSSTRALQRNRDWRWIAWRDLLVAHERALPVDCDDEAYLQFRRTLWDHTG